MSEFDVGRRAYWRHIASWCHVMKNRNTLRIFPTAKGGMVWLNELILERRYPTRKGAHQKLLLSKADFCKGGGEPPNSAKEKIG